MAKKATKATKPTKLETNAGTEKPGPVEKAEEENPRVVEHSEDANFRCTKCLALVYFKTPANFAAALPPNGKCPKCGELHALGRFDPANPTLFAEESKVTEKPGEKLPNPRVVEGEAEANYKCNREDCQALVHWDPPADYPAGQPPFLKCPKCGKTNVLFRRKVKPEKKDAVAIELKTSAPEVELKEMELAEQRVAEEQAVAEQQLEKVRVDAQEFYKNTEMEQVLAHAFITRMDPTKLIVVPEWKALVSRLKPKDEQELEASLDSHGMLDPIKALISGKIIDGFTRQAWAIKRKRPEVQVMSLDIPEEKAEFWVRAFNTYRRQMTIGEKAFQAVEMLKLEKKYAAERQERGRKLATEKSHAPQPATTSTHSEGTDPLVDQSGKSPAAMPNEAPKTPAGVPEEEKGRALDKVAKLTGLSHTTVNNAATVQAAAEAGDPEAKKLMEDVKEGKKSITAAAKIIREKRKVHAADISEKFLEVTSLNRVVQQLAGKISQWSNTYEKDLKKEEKTTLAKCGDMVQDISKEIYIIEERLKTVKKPPQKRSCDGCHQIFDPKELVEDEDDNLLCKECAEDPCACCTDYPEDCPECSEMKGFKFRNQCLQCQNCDSATCPNPDWECPTCETCNDPSECEEESEESGEESKAETDDDEDPCDGCEEPESTCDHCASNPDGEGTEEEDEA